MNFAARSSLIITGVVVGVVVSTAPAMSAARTPTRTARVCIDGGTCYPTLSGALSAAPASATVRIGPGVVRGGVVITKSVRVVGAGQRRSVISGGGPVLTVVGSPSVHVAFSGLRISGGRTRGDQLSGQDFRAVGGGLYVRPVVHAMGDPTVGATVALRRVTVSGNRVDPTGTSPSPSGVQCPDGDCPYALAAGGGIASFGTLTLDDSIVSNNSAGPRASDADGGGIYSDLGDLTVRSSVVRDNRAVAARIGRFAEGGGVFVESGDLEVQHTLVAGNRADLDTRWPARAQGNVIDMNAHGGGIHVGDGSLVRVSHSRLTRNSVSAIDPVGEPYAVDSAMLVNDSELHLDHTTVDHNSVRAVVATAEDVGSSGTALEADGPALITDTRVVANPVWAYSENGQAIATGGLAVYDFAGNPRQVTVRRTVISGNVAEATSHHGSALVKGAGLVNNSLLDLDHVIVSGNVGIAHSPDATAQGGGVWNGVDLSGPPVVLRMTDSLITRNALSTSVGGTRQGGGLFTTQPVMALRTAIKHNRPTDCFGC